MKTSKKLLFIAIAIVALMTPAAVASYTTVWNQQVCEVTVREPIQVISISAISAEQTIWPGQTVTYGYEITNLAPRTYRIEIGGALNGWENGQRKAWCGISAPTVTVSYLLEYITGGPYSHEGSAQIYIHANETLRLTIYLYFHDDVEAGDWSFYLSVGRLSVEGLG